METIIKVFKGFNAETGEPIYAEVSVIACAGTPEGHMDANHIRVHVDPDNPNRRTRRKPDGTQTEIPLNDPRIPRRRSRQRTEP